MTSETLPGGGAHIVRAALRKGWSAARKRTFLKILSETLNVSEAARSVQMDRKSAYALKARDPAFARNWSEALDAAYAEVEMVLLQQSRDGSVRTETVKDGESGQVKLSKTVHSYPLAVATRLLLSHKDEVIAHRVATMQSDEDDKGIARVRAHMDLVRERLQQRFAAPSTAGPLGDARPPQDED